MAAIAGCGSRCLRTSFQISASSCNKESGCSSSSSHFLRRIAGHGRVVGGNVAARTRRWKVMAAGSSKGNGKDKRGIKLDEEDMMTLEFGRLLGESRQTTLSKVLRSKADPDAKFLDIEEALQKGTPARSVVKPAARQELQDIQQFRRDAKASKTPESEDALPQLMSRPARPRGAQEAVGPSARAVKPLSKKSKVEDYDYSQLIRKPVVVSATNGLPPQLSPMEVIRPMTMRRATQNIAASQPLQNSSLLRKPSFGAVNQAPSELVTSDGNVTTSGSSTSSSETNATPSKSSLQPPAQRASPSQPKPTATLLRKPADVLMPSSKLLEKNYDTIDGSLGSSASLMSEAVPKETVADIQGQDAAIEDITTDRYAGWSEEVQRVLLKTEESTHTEELESRKADVLSNGRSTERKQGILRRPAAPQVGEPSIQSAKQQLQDTRPYVPKPLAEVVPKSNRVEQPGDALRSLSKKIMSSPDEELAVDETNDSYWAQAEALHEAFTVIEVEIVRVAGDGVLASFGPLFAYLPAWELGSDRGIPSFSSWGQARGMDVTQRKAATGVLAQPREDRDQTLTVNSKSPGGDSLDLKLAIPTPEERQNLLDAYKKERETELTALIGTNASVVITAVDKARQKITISERRSEGAAFELAQKKASLIAALKIGDVVTCLVKRVNSIGAFVELEGVPALIHSSELSWNRVTDPTTVLVVGQEVKVKVSRLDRHLQRISLSLRQMQVDPLQETLESLVSSKVMAAKDAELPESELPELVELQPVLNRLLKTDGVYGAVKGQGFRGSALATSFQIYLSEPVSDGYKLLARSGNAVQEILVQTSLTKEEMKKVIFNCVMEGDGELQV